MRKNKRVYSLDVIRVTAIFAVIMIHASAEFVDGAALNSFEFCIANVTDSIARMGVPLFIMLSGALMLNEERMMPPSKAVRKAVRIYANLLIWSTIYAGVFYVLFPTYCPSFLNIERSWSAFIRAVARGHYHLWYLSMIIGLYLVTPVLRLFVKKQNRGLIKYLLLLMIAVKSALPFVNYCADRLCGGESLFSLHFRQFDFSFISSYMMYYISGWYLVNSEFTKRQQVALAVLGITGVICTILCTRLFSTDSYRAYGFFYSYDSLNIVAESLATFALMSHAFTNLGDRNAGWVKRLSELSFGVYLIHPLILFLVDKFSVAMAISNVHGERMLVNCLLTTLISFLLSLMGTRIPGIRRIMKA